MTDLLTPEEVVQLLYNCAKFKHKRRGKDFDLKLHDVEMAMNKGCSRTGILFDHRRHKHNPFRASLDRIDNSIGYTPDNIQVVSRMYNVAKWTWTDEQVYFMARAMVSHQTEGGWICPPNYPLD